MTAHWTFTGPLYQQIYLQLKNRIVSADWPAGTSIPGDVDLSRQIGVSVGTVRKALDQLAREGFVHRERGRGTFVKESNFWSGQAKGWLYDSRGRPVNVTIEVEEVTTCEASPAESSALQLQQSRTAAATVHRVLRLWRYQGEVVCVERVSVDSERIPKLPARELLSVPSLVSLCLPGLGHQNMRTVWKFSHVAIDDDRLRHMLQASLGQIMSCQRITYGAGDLPVKMSDQLIRIGALEYRIAS